MDFTLPLVSAIKPLTKMKRIFGRDKPKMTKVTREITTSLGPTAVLEVRECILSVMSLLIFIVRTLQESTQYPPIYHQYRTPREAVPPRSMGRPSSDGHWEALSTKDDDNHSSQLKPHHQEREQLQHPRPLALAVSRSSSLASLPPGASPPIPSPNAPRSASPYSNTTASHTQGRGPTPRERDRDVDKSRKVKQQPAAPGSGPPHSGAAAIGILKALDPFAVPDAPPDRESKSYKHDQSEDGFGDERKEKKGFWGKEKDKGKERKDEDSPAELTRMIGEYIGLADPIGQMVNYGYGVGFLTATASEDWSLVLEVCDRASASEANAKEAVKALRREFKCVAWVSQFLKLLMWY